MEFICDKTETTEGKGENARYQHFLFSLNVFKKLLPRIVKCQDCVVKIECFSCRHTTALRNKAQNSLMMKYLSSANEFSPPPFTDNQPLDAEKANMSIIVEQSFMQEESVPISSTLSKQMTTGEEIFIRPVPNLRWNWACSSMLSGKISEQSKFRALILQLYKINVISKLKFFVR